MGWRERLTRFFKPRGSAQTPPGPGEADESEDPFAPYLSQALGYCAPPRDRAELDQWAASNGYRLDEIFTDSDPALDPRQRPGLQQLLERLCRGPYVVVLVPTYGDLSSELEHQRGLQFEFLHDDLEVVALHGHKPPSEARCEAATLQQGVRWRYGPETIKTAQPGPYQDSKLGFQLQIPFGWVHYLPAQEEEGGLYLLRRTARREVGTLRVIPVSGGVASDPEDEILAQMYLEGLEAVRVKENRLTSLGGRPTRSLIFVDGSGTWHKEHWIRPDIYIQGSASAGFGSLLRMRAWIERMMDTLVIGTRP